MPSPDLTLAQRMAQRGVSRRDFLKFCTAVASTLALPKALTPQVAYALETAAKRPPVVWLEFQDCAGDTESFLRASRPTAAQNQADLERFVRALSGAAGLRNGARADHQNET